MVTARAIVCGEHNNYQIHVNISFKPSWKKDVLIPALSEPETSPATAADFQIEDFASSDVFNLDVEIGEEEFFIKNN